MRKLRSTTLAVVFAAGLLLNATTAHAQRLGSVEAKSGMEVAARVQGLRRDSMNVNAALQHFERRGHRPKIDEASSISGTIERADKEARSERGFAIRKANFAQTIRDGSIELIFVPTIDAPNEWQGTMIARLYNEFNQVIGEEVFNLVVVQETTGRWSPVYELSFLSGYTYVHYEPGMYGAFALGITIADHPAVTGSAPAIDVQPWQWGGELHPCPFGPERVDPLLPNCEPSLRPVGRSRGTPPFRPVSYRAVRLVPQGFPPPQERFPMMCPGHIPCYRVGNVFVGFIGPRIRQTAHDAFPYCVTAGITGGGLPGFARGCGSALIYQAGRHIFRIW